MPHPDRRAAPPGADLGRVAMTGEWRAVRLGEVSELVTKGTTPTSLGYRFTEVGVNFVKSESITHDGSIDGSKFARVDAATHAALRRSQLQEGDLLFSMAGVYIGKTAVVPRAILPANTNQAVGIIRLDRTRAHPRFVDYFIRNPSYNQFVNNLVSQSAQPNLNLGEIRNLPLSLPPLAEQEAIAGVLGSLDDKIGVNRRMNTTLEATARALFHRWFVELELDGLGAPAAPRGSLPSGWRGQNLDQIAHFLNGLALQNYPPGARADLPDLPVIKITQLRRGDVVGADRCDAAIPPEYIVGDGDVLFSWSGSLEVELWCGGVGALNQHLFKVTSRDFPRWFYYLWTSRHLAEFRRIAAAKATTMGHIQRGHLSAARVLVPPGPLLEAMTRIMAPLIDRIVANRVQSRALAVLRDTLLPRLLGGELRPGGPAQARTIAPMRPL